MAKLLCKFGFHEWGRWFRASLDEIPGDPNEGSVTRIRRCERDRCRMIEEQ